jgi:SagB-type dehydrogenase family enzyme
VTPSGFLLVVAPGVALELRQHRIQVTSRGWVRFLETGSSEAGDALLRLAGGVTEGELVGAMRHGGVPAIAGIHFCLQCLRDWGVLQYRVPLGRSFAQVRPSRRNFRLQGVLPDQRLLWVLSRFACLRRAEGGLVLESPVAPASVLFEDPDEAAGVIRFGAPRRIEPEAFPLINLLVETKFLQPADETEGAALRTWEFHDLLFHTQTSADDSARARGRTERFRGELQGPPAARPVADGEVVALPRPEAEALWASDPPLARVSDLRKSVRTSGIDPITLTQLTEFLWRVARLPRPLPGAGGLNELEFYAAVNSCDGLERGLYYYSGAMHELGRIGPSAAFESLLLAARAALGTNAQTPQVIIVVTARFARMAWSYETIAYRNILLDAGIALHALYLAATAMNLAPCAIGWNDPVLFSAAAGADPVEESSVALFALSSAAPVAESP